MKSNLWYENSPQNFWLCDPNPPDHIWQDAIQKSLPVLGLDDQIGDVRQILHLTLGEGQFGLEHWQLSHIKRLYYHLKPLLPRWVIDSLKSFHSQFAEDNFPLEWPIEKRYAHFQWEVIRQLLIDMDPQSFRVKRFWPQGQCFAFVLTHDVETKEGQDYARALADIDESYDFRSSFNFVPERYQLDYRLIADLRERGFEIGIHGLIHDGKLFRSETEFMRRAALINTHLKELGAVGFRSPLMMRNPEWMQVLEIEYDLSFFDTDPYEPMPGGTMSIWPFTLGRFLELPYTLAQDCTLTTLLGERTPKLWIEKIDFIERYQGMALLNTHPDYLPDPITYKVYTDFLDAMRRRGGFWHAVPREVARWWLARSSSELNPDWEQAGCLWEDANLVTSGICQV